VEDDAAEGVAGERLVAQVGEPEDDTVGVADGELLPVGLELHVPVVRVDATAVKDDEIFVMVDVRHRAHELDDLPAEVFVEALLRGCHTVHAAVDDGFGMEVIGVWRSRRLGRACNGRCYRRRRGCRLICDRRGCGRCGRRCGRWG
jgi:hypothetical protein